MANKVVTNFLIPNHKKLSEKEIIEITQKYSIEKKNLPKINIKDPALTVHEIEAEEGDVIQITRKSFAGERAYYRLVVA